MSLDKYELKDVTVKLNQEQLDWVNSIIERYFAVTGRTLTVDYVLRRVFHHGWSNAENEMAKFERNHKNDKKDKQYGHLTLID